MSFSSKAKFMIGFFLISLRPSIPVFNIIFYIFIPSDKGFAPIDSDDFDNLGPLIDYISLFISLYDSGLDVIEVIDSILHIEIPIELNILGVDHFLIIGHFDG